MRLRNVPGAREVMIENEYVFTEPEGMKGTWSQVFGNDNPIRIEIGMGKGTFKQHWQQIILILIMWV